MPRIKKVVRGGKIVKKVQCKPGQKAVKGRCVRMSGSEKIARKRAAKVGARKSKSKRAGAARKRKISMRKGRSLRR